MRMLRTYRVGGDSLSVWFGPDGALSTAYLETPENRHLVTSQLPGLKASNAFLYLAELGFYRHYDDVCRAIGQSVNEVLQGEDVYIESVYRWEDKICLSAIHHLQRTRACPTRLFLALYRADRDHISFRNVQDQRAVDVFYERVVKCGRIGNVRV